MSSHSASNNSSRYHPSYVQVPNRIMTNHYMPQRTPCYNLDGRSDVLPCGGSRTHTALPHYTKYLEGKIATIQEQHQNAITENINLNNQVSRAIARVQELEETILKERRDYPQVQRREIYQHKANQEDNELRQTTSTQLQHRGVNTLITRYLEASSSTANPRTLDSAGQTDDTIPDESPQPQPNLVDSSCDPCTDFVSISRTELENLEYDMKTLRNAVRAKEAQWDQALEREHNYRKHMAQLSVELMTARQLSETRYNEMQILVQKLSEKKEELKGVQKDLLATKKALSKCQEQQKTALTQNS